MPRLLCIGDVNGDITIAADSEIAPGSDTAGDVALTAGGSAANVAATAAASGTPTRFAGVVGDDLLGRLLTDELQRDGVEVRPVVRPDARSRCVAAIISSSGDRSMVSDLGSATVMGVDDVDAAWFDDVDWVHLTAYSWFPVGGDEVLARLTSLASERGIAWSIDPSSAQMLRSSRSIRDAITAFEGAAVLFPNQDEAAALTDETDPATAAMRLLDVADTVVVTCGADGVVLAGRHAPPRRTAAHDAHVVNALGAGDAFAGGFITSRMAGHDDDVATHEGLAAAARAVARPTAR